MVLILPWATQLWKKWLLYKPPKVSPSKRTWETQCHKPSIWGWFNPHTNTDVGDGLWNYVCHITRHCGSQEFLSQLAGPWLLAILVKQLDPGKAASVPALGNAVGVTTVFINRGILPYTLTFISWDITWCNPSYCGYIAPYNWNCSFLFFMAFHKPTRGLKPFPRRKYDQLLGSMDGQNSWWFYMNSDPMMYDCY